MSIPQNPTPIVTITAAIIKSTLEFSGRELILEKATIIKIRGVNQYPIVKNIKIMIPSILLF